MRSAALVCAAATAVRAGDPSGGWLCYARYDAPNPTDIITKLAMDFTVPEEPSPKSGDAAYWFGVQTTKGDGALIQPIESKWRGSWEMFHEIYDWTPGTGGRENSGQSVPAGDVLSAYVLYHNDTRSYSMNMTSAKTGKTSHYQYKLSPNQHATEATGYIVLEHQQSKCGEYGAGGKASWTNIEVHVNGKKVASPKWVAHTETPRCGSKAVINSPTAVDITWDPSASE